jgi:hypothetical protein
MILKLKKLEKLPVRELDFREEMLRALDTNNLDDYDVFELVQDIEVMIEEAYASNKKDRAATLEKIVKWIVEDNLNRAGRQELKKLVEKHL